MENFIRKLENKKELFGYFRIEKYNNRNENLIYWFNGRVEYCRRERL